MSTALALLSSAAGVACRPRPRQVAWQPDGGWSETSEPARSVYFKQLTAFLPASVPGFQTVRDEGSTGKYGSVTVTEVERVFAHDNEEIAVRIVDSTMMSGLAEGIAAASEAARRQAKETAAPLSLPAAVGYVRYDASEQRAEANLLVGDRFVLSVSGRGLKDSQEVRRIAESLDSEKLANLR